LLRHARSAAGTSLAARSPVAAAELEAARHAENREVDVRRRVRQRGVAVRARAAWLASGSGSRHPANLRTSDTIEVAVR
jgi:uncharacterized protein with PIN domain